MFKHTWYYNYDTAVPSPVDWGDQSRCFQLFFDVLHDVTVNMTRVRRRIGNMRQYASIYVNILSNILRIGIHCINVKMSICVNIGRPILICVNMCQYASICVNTRQYASICVNMGGQYGGVRKRNICCPAILTNSKVQKI